MNRILAVLAVPLLAASLIAPAHAYPSREWRFNVLLDNKPIGRHSFVLSLDQHQQVLKSEAEYNVKFLGFNAYRYQHTAVWRPQTMLTMQGMIERILEGDGITREMIQEQQKRLQLIQRLAGASEDVLQEVVKTEDKIIDSSFFTLLSGLIEVAAMGGDNASAAKLGDLQKKLLPITTFGRQVQDQNREVQAAIQTLRDAGKDLTRERLLEFLIAAPTEIRLNVLVSLTRSGLDYTFFQMMSERIDRASGDNKQKLAALRERILELTRQIDQAGMGHIQSR